MEIYKNFFENYEISNMGNIRHKLKSGNYKNVKSSIASNGYKYIQLQRNGKRINFYIHQQVAKIFIGERPKNLVVDHIDRNKYNNKSNNLRYVTYKENRNNNEKNHIYRENLTFLVFLTLLLLFFKL